MCLILEFMDQFMNITLGKKIARNWGFGLFSFGYGCYSFCTQDRTYDKQVIMFAVGYVSCRTVKTGRKYSETPSVTAGFHC